MKELEFFKLEDRVLFEAAAVAEIVEAAEMAQNAPNADENNNHNEQEPTAQPTPNALNNAPIENPATPQQDAHQTQPDEISDVDAVINQLIDGEIPQVDADNMEIVNDLIGGNNEDTSVENEFIDGVIIENGSTFTASGIDVNSGFDLKNDDLQNEIFLDNGLTVSTEKELVVINSSVADKDVILAELKPNQNVFIFEEKNGLTELNEFLDEQETEYSAIHFVTHGGEGYLSINGELIDNPATDDKRK